MLFLEGMRQDNKRNREDKLRRDMVHGFVVDGEEKLVQDSTCAQTYISIQLEIIDRNFERMMLEREKDEADDLFREKLSNSGAADLDVGNTQGLALAEDTCYAEETNDINRSEDEALSVSNAHQS